MGHPKLELLASNGVATFVMPFSITLNARVTPGCTMQKYECIRVLNTNQEAVPLNIHTHWKVGNCMGKCIKCLDALHRIEPCSYTA